MSCFSDKKGQMRKCVWQRKAGQWGTFLDKALVNHLLEMKDTEAYLKLAANIRTVNLAGH